MFGAFVEKVKDAFGVNSISEGHVVPDDTTVDHDDDSATIPATSHAWEKAKDKVAYVKDVIAQSVQFGSIAYCTKDAEDHHEDFVTSTWGDDDLISSGTDDRKFVIRGGLKGISKNCDDGDLPIHSKIERVRRSSAHQHKDMERAGAKIGIRTK